MPMHDASETKRDQERTRERLIQRAVRIVFPELSAVLSPHEASLDVPSKSAALSETLRLLIALFAEARQLGSCPFLPKDPAIPSDASLRAREQLSRDDGEARIDFALLPVRCLGEIYERLLAEDRQERKSRGSFYTPQIIVDYIVTQTLGPACDRWLDARNVPVAADACRVLDPAMGTGHFLVAAMRYLATRLWACEPPENQTPDHLKKLMHWVATHLIHGIDLDPMAVQLARASLWLEIALPELSYEPLNAHLRCGDALSEATADDWPRFDAIVGNPPYGSHIDLPTRKRLSKHLLQMKHNGDAAVGFVERSSQLLSDGGRCGLIVPKPLTYSFAWRELRKFLARRVEHVVDVSRAWPEVKLEQVIIVFGPRSEAGYYETAEFSSRGFTPRMRLSWRWAERFGTLPCALNRQERRRLDDLQWADLTVGEIVRTWRGMPLQSQLRPQGDIPMLGGRDLSRWRVRSSSGFVAAASLPNVDCFQPPKLVFQNIIAHVARPEPHVLLIGAYDVAGHVTLDTVNNLLPRETGWPLEGLLALLHSRLVNWFVYRVIYNNAIRTMHFDQYFLNKIPLPRGYQQLFPQLAALAAAASANQSLIAEAENALATELRDSAGVTLSGRTLAALLDGRDTRHSCNLEMHRARARGLLQRRLEIHQAIDRAVDIAYGVPDVCGDEVGQPCEEFAVCTRS